jgi:serine/threonine protein kinase/Flp pilus assembly protein TadD
MTEPAVSNLSADPRFADLIEELTEKFQSGQPVDFEACLREHPEYADQIRQLLPALRILADVSRSGGPTGILTNPDDPTSGVLGDFRLIREVGRGGMGVVYEAEQISLGRRVALKVLPFAATMDPRHLVRFQNEARAAASLEHPHIVPVYAVGCERGVHYYAMKFIEGQTVAALIAQQRADLKPAPTTPAADTTPRAQDTTAPMPRDAAYFRRAAEWGIQAADALEHAHSLGIVHRDIKPANLMIDGQGKLWVTDFGLARTATDAGLTMTGDVLGTLRYMSPEQAQASHGLVDHRTDVYSLGVTLYELLTLRPAVKGEDRARLLQRICLEEPVAPTSICKTIPQELETIIQKAIERSPAERYATAKDLAEDLQRYLRDQTIRAKRPSLVHRTRKWARRQRGLIAAGTVCLLVASAVLAGSVGWVTRDHAARRAHNTQVVTAALEETNSWQQKRRLPEALSAARRADGLLAGADVDESLQQQVRARLADLELVDKLENVRLEQGTVVKDGHFDWKGADELFGQTFRDAGLEVETLSVEEAGERIRRSTVAGELAVLLDHWAMFRRYTRGAEDTIWRHLLHVARLADPDTERTKMREALERGDSQALRAAAASEEVFHLPVATLSVLGYALLADKDRSHAEAFLRKAQRRHPDDFWLNHNLFLHFKDKHPPQREEAIRFAALAVGLRPASPGAHFNLGAALKDNGKVDEAIAEYREAIDIKKDYGEAHRNLGYALWEQGKVDLAIAEYREAIGINKNDSDAHNNLGVALMSKGLLDEAIVECKEAIQVRKNNAEAHNSLGVALQNKGRLEEAITEYGVALSLKNTAECHSNLGGALMVKGQLKGAITEFQKALQLNDSLPQLHNNLGNALKGQGQLDEAIAEFGKAIRLKYDSPEPHCSLGDAFMRQGQFLKAVDEFRIGRDLGSRNPQWPYAAQVAQQLRDAERLANLDARLPKVLKGEEQPKDAAERLALADLCQRYKKQYAAATRFFADAFGAQPNLAEDLNAGNRYNAACAAALAGSGRGEDAAQLDDQKRVRLRQQALDWLGADLAAYRRMLDKEPDNSVPVTRQRMQHWQQDRDFVGLRHPEALAKLPEAEQTAWRQLWADVAAILERTQPKPGTEKKPDTK